MCLEKRTSAASRQAHRLFTARLNPCPSFDSLFPSLLGSVKASGAVQIDQLKNLIWTGLKLSRPSGTRFRARRSHADSLAPEVRLCSRQRRTQLRREMTSPQCLEKRTSAAKAVKRTGCLRHG